MITQYPLHPCPSCTRKPLISTAVEETHLVSCGPCGLATEACSTIEKAVREWNIMCCNMNLLNEVDAKRADVIYNVPVET